MTEFGTLEIVTEVEPKVKEAELTSPQPQTIGTNSIHSPEQNKTSNPTAKPRSNTEHQTSPVGEKQELAHIPTKSFALYLFLRTPFLLLFSVSADPHRQAGVNNTRSPSAVESPSVSTVPNAIVPMTEATANCRSCGHSGSRESFLQGKYCSAPCVQPTSGRYMFLAFTELS